MINWEKVMHDVLRAVTISTLSNYNAVATLRNA